MASRHAPWGFAKGRVGYAKAVAVFRNTRAAFAKAFERFAQGRIVFAKAGR